ncbi:beta-N-acetylhexosaminidase [uncultured Microbacterium sp.]|uniref:beta-N-acetylhexosaminidase n=1 Tax=uncultured Microbacterium sp. TaxID=191216 RepID=UPI0035C993AA
MLLPRARTAAIGAARDTALDAATPGFRLEPGASIRAAGALVPVAGWLQDRLRPSTGFSLPIDEAGAVRLEIAPDLGVEAYRLSVDESGVTIAGGSPAGVFYGCQSLLQLLPADVHRRGRVRAAPWIIPAVEVADEPRYAWRGTMLDVARHFLPKHDVLRFLDLMAMHKLNRLHLHLTDDQGWRIQILRYPRLTEIGAWRHESPIGADRSGPHDGRPHGGYYTQDDIREIVDYAAARFITVIPEIESPGHVQAAIAAYPELGMSDEPLPVWTEWGINGNVLNAEESTVDFFLGVFDEVMDLFPGPWVGVGGDECPRDQWAANARVQERMRDLGLVDPGDVQSWFVARLAAHIGARGRRIFGWDELLEGDLAEGAVVASWRGMTGASVAARRGVDVVSCPDDVTYLDYRQSEDPDEPIPVSIPLTVRDAYSFDPMPAGLDAEQATHILGGQANIWTEYIDSPRTLDYFSFPRLCAIAEVLWSGAEGDVEEFLARLEVEHLPRLRAFGVEYRDAAGPRPWQRRPGIPGRPQTRQERAEHISELVAALSDG